MENLVEHLNADESFKEELKHRYDELKFRFQKEPEELVKEDPVAATIRLRRQLSL